MSCWQVYHDSEEGQRYIQFYKLNKFPYISILDPRTGLCPWVVDNSVICLFGPVCSRTASLSVGGYKSYCTGSLDIYIHLYVDLLRDPELVSWFSHCALKRLNQKSSRECREKEHSGLCMHSPSVVWLDYTRTENGGVEPARRGIVSGAGDWFPGGARAARWSFLPRTPSQACSFCRSLFSNGTFLTLLFYSRTPVM